MRKIAMRGEISIPASFSGGTSLRMGSSTGSVIWCRKRTTGLYGSGDTHERRARMMMTQE